MNKLNLNNLKRITFGTLTAIVLSLLLIAPKLVFANSGFQTGNMYLVSNTNNPAFTDPVNANVGDIVQFHLEIDNIGSDTAKNVKVRAEFPANVSGSSIVSTIHVTADNASEFVETATVNLPNTSTTKNLVYFPGHATLIIHPGNITSSIENIGTGNAVLIGDLPAGNGNFMEVTFKAQITENVAPTPTPTPTATPTPAPTAPPANNNNTNNNCTGNNSCSGTANASVNITGPTPVAPVVTTLPKTGLPEIAWSALALIPAGFSMRRFSKSKRDLRDHPSYIAENRKFKSG